jgi:cytochrome c biogenesis protein CcmG/thiol:disulfide interchange protein DsbE
VQHYAGGVRRTAPTIAVLAALALVALLVYGVVGAGGKTTLDDAVKRGDRPAAPVRDLPSLDGGTASLADYKGKPVLLNFWASWCEPCKAEAPVLERAHARLRRAGGAVLGVTVSDQSDDSRAFLREHGLSFPSLRDVDGRLGDDYGTTGVPETFVIDRDGRVAAISRGSVDEAFVTQALDRVLG